MRAPIAEAVARDLADPKLYAKIAARHGITPARHAVESPGRDPMPLWLVLFAIAAVVAVTVLAVMWR